MKFTYRILRVKLIRTLKVLILKTIRIAAHNGFKHHITKNMVSLCGKMHFVFLCQTYLLPFKNTFIAAHYSKYIPKRRVMFFYKLINTLFYRCTFFIGC